MAACEPKWVYFLSGIGTWKSGNLFGGAMEYVKRKYREAGCAEVHVRDLYPYGTVDGIKQGELRKHLVRQALMVNKDMAFRHARRGGGGQAYREICWDLQDPDAGGIVLVGHSGGGVAACHTAQLLQDEGYKVDQVILVGSPEQRIGKLWADRVHHIRKSGRIGDPVTWWGRPCFRGAKQNETVDIVGGHTEYFSQSHVDGNGVSNLQKVMDKMWKWIRPKE